MLIWHLNLILHSHCYYHIRNLILAFARSWKMLYSILTIALSQKCYFDIHNPFWNSHWAWNGFLIFEVLFEHSHWVVKGNFAIQNPILAFTPSQKMLIWYLESSFDIRTESRNVILIFKIWFWHLHWVEKCCLTFEILFWHSHRVEKILFWHSKSYFDISTESKNVNNSLHAILTFVILFWYSHWVQNTFLIFALSQKC